MNDRIRPGAYDAVVIGGGSAGCVVAGELSADPARRVLVLEAGPAAEAHPETLDADGYKTAFINDEVFHERFTVAQPHAANQRIFAGTGSVMGGSGSVNGMVYTRGDKRDFDEWPDGWKWSDVVPHFEELERELRPRRRAPTRWTEACISAAEASGFERRDDLNDGELGNVVGYEWMTYEGDRRRSSYVAFLAQRDRPNLDVRTGARVHRIVFDGRRAVAVEYAVGSQFHTAQVQGEVILCAGALETPRLLMLSGVGPGQALRAHGISEVLDHRGVGENLHDHPNVPLFFLGRHVVDCKYPQLYSFFRTDPSAPLPQGQSDTCYVFWPAPSAMKEATQRVLPGKVLPQRVHDTRAKHWMRTAIGAAWKIPVVPRVVDHLFGIVVILGKPFSRGSVRLQSSNPDAPGIVDPAYFSDPRDMNTLVLGVQKARAMARAGGLADWRALELMPGPLSRSPEAVARWVAKNAITTYHFAGTCRMGDDAASVCDPQLRVRGLDNVRIGDASAVPTTPVSAMNAPSMLVGHRAAAFVRATAPVTVH